MPEEVLLGVRVRVDIAAVGDPDLVVQRERFGLAHVGEGAEGHQDPIQRDLDLRLAEAEQSVALVVREEVVGLDRAQQVERPAPVDQVRADGEAIGLRGEARGQLVRADLDIEAVRGGEGRGQEAVPHDLAQLESGDLRLELDVAFRADAGRVGSRRPIREVLVWGLGLEQGELEEPRKMLPEGGGQKEADRVQIETAPRLVGRGPIIRPAVDALKVEAGVRDQGDGRDRRDRQDAHCELDVRGRRLDRVSEEPPVTAQLEGVAGGVERGPRRVAGGTGDTVPAGERRHRPGGTSPEDWHQRAAQSEQREGDRYVSSHDVSPHRVSRIHRGRSSSRPSETGPSQSFP